VAFFMEQYFTYIIFSEKLNKYYVGSTNNLLRRLEDHNRGKTSFAKVGMPWQLKYFETFTSRKESVSRELQIKKRKSRLYILSLIATNPKLP
jgi:putative endonuclease